MGENTGGTIFDIRKREEWRPTIRSLMSDIITESLIEEIRGDPPDCFASDDPSWIDEMVQKEIEVVKDEKGFE
ncbi:MAG: hypothetical protein KC964_22185 [Candidatus Omnitrophica bacterium]|nr:hypothetical protein [Candidatus Omnitrophota bacterium]